MTPAQKAAKVHQAIRLFREQNSEVRHHAASLDDTNVLDLGELEEQHDLKREDSGMEVGTPAEVSERMLVALFGAWPPKSRIGK